MTLHKREKKASQRARGSRHHRSVLRVVKVDFDEDKLRSAIAAFDAPAAARPKPALPADEQVFSPDVMAAGEELEHRLAMSIASKLGKAPPPSDVIAVINPPPTSAGSGDAKAGSTTKT